MSPKTRKHVPQRTCVGCREVLAKRSLIRVVRTSNGVKIDPTSKAQGRGAYVHERRECWNAALKGSLARALRAELSAADRIELEQHVRLLPDRPFGLAKTSTSSDLGELGRAVEPGGRDG